MVKIASILIIAFLIVAPSLSHGVIVCKHYYCDACPDATGGADQLCEMPDGTSDGLCGWTIVETDADVDMASTIPGSFSCTDHSEYAVKFYKSGTSTSEAKIYKTASGSTFYVQGFFYLTTIPASELLYIFTLSDTSNLPSVRIRVTYEDPTYYVYWGYHEEAGWTESPVAVSLNTWYAFRLYVVNSTSDTIQFWIDLNNDGDFEDTNEHPTADTGKTLDRATARYMVGTASDVSSSYTYYVTGIKVDDDTMPDVCAR